MSSQHTTAPTRPRGPFAVGEQVQITDPKGRKHTVVLQPGKQFHTHQGALDHDALIGAPEGVVVTSTGGTPYLAFRPLLTDFLWEAQKRWIDAYEARRLTNKLDDLRLSRIDFARVERDRYYDAVTVRVFASCKDYTVNDHGEVVGGDPRRARRFTEYWTFIRAAGGTREGAQRAKCPSCGAPLDRIGQAGTCGYCGAKVTAGDFGWVLAAIVQDEDYGDGV